MQKEEWDALNLKEIRCPKCGRAGFLVRKGQNDSGNFVATCRKAPKKEDTGCGRDSVESLIMKQVAQPAPKAIPKAKYVSNNTNPNIEQLQADVEDLKKMVAQLLNPEIVKPQVNIDNSAFNWGKYSLEIQDRIKDELLPVLDDYPDKNIREIEKEVRNRNKYGKSLRRQSIIEVKKAWVAGAFGH